MAVVATCTMPVGAAAKGFRLGVAAGEARPTQVKLWARANRPGPVRLSVATDRRLRDVVKGKRLAARKRTDLTAQATVSGLRPGRTYFYRFCTRRGRACSAKGRFQTAPRRNANARVRFAYTGDTDATAEAPGEPPFFGSFKVFKRMRGEGNAFNVHLGDTIYSDSEVAGAPPALSVKAKWAKYRANLRQANLRRLRAAASLYSHWDDHEFINDFSIPEDGEELYERGVRAFRDYAPVTYTKARGLYRSFRWGANLELFFLDERSFRSAKASAEGVCDNPDTEAPDLAPTAPQPVRDLFALLIPSLANPVSQECKDALNDPGRTLLGAAQHDRFLDAVEGSTATWKVVMNETPIQQFYGLPYDRWEGYAHERVALLSELEARDVENLVFLTTDTHANFANVVRYRTLSGDVAPGNAPDGPTDSPYQDFVTGPVATNTFFREIDQVTGGEGDGLLLATAFFKPPPPAGVGMSCAQGDQFSYAEVTATATQLRIDYRTEAGERVTDVTGVPCGPYTLLEGD
jgi:phosphodiesterase/alkaline phosphatase D-like protein